MCGPASTCVCEGNVPLPIFVQYLHILCNALVKGILGDVLAVANAVVFRDYFVPGNG